MNIVKFKILTTMQHYITGAIIMNNGSLSTEILKVKYQFGIRTVPPCLNPLKTAMLIIPPSTTET